MRTNIQGKLNLNFSLDIGRDGLDQDENNPLSRAIRRLVALGQPLKRCAPSYYKHRGDDTLRWIGMFVHSAGDRVIFFPGYSDFPIGLLPSANLAQRHSSVDLTTFIADHVTLEPNFKGIHMTAPGSLTQKSCGKPRKVSDHGFLWFGMSVSHPEHLRIVMKETEISALISESDLQRRMSRVQEAFGGGTAPLTRLSPQSVMHDPGFLHFTFLVGKKGFDAYAGPIFLDPYSSGFTSSAKRSDVRGIALSRYRLDLSSTIDIEILVSWLPGKLTGQVAFSYPKKAPPG